MPIKLITFDLDNTLWHTDPVIIRAEEVQWQQVKKLCPSFDQLFTPASLQLLKLQTIQQHPELRHKLSQLRLEFLYQVFIKCGITKQQALLFAEQTFAVFLQARNQVVFFPHALNLLETLQSDYQVIALSNGNADLKDIGIDHLFNAHFHAENVANPKPHSDMFVAALEFSGVEPNESIHIGDHPEQDVFAAREMGFKTVWANILEQRWPSVFNPADHEIGQLDQLINILAESH
jgi:HAD superfamily hydrolase (TIGR01509 family)